MHPSRPISSSGLQTSIEAIAVNPHLSRLAIDRPCRSSEERATEPPSHSSEATEINKSAVHISKHCKS